MTTAAQGWVEAGDGYSLTIDAGKIVCKNAKDNVLKSVPAKVKKTDVHGQMKQMLDWLTEHERTCLETVDAWMLRSLPVPRSIIEAVWDDTAWRKVIENAIVAPLDFAETGDDELIGFLRGVEDGKIGLVNLDGETEWLDVERVLLPHPVLLPDLEDFRELALELEIEQGLQQLFRETFDLADKTFEENQKSINDFSDGKFDQLNWAIGRCRTLGYQVRGGFACCPVWENGTQAEARYWIGADYPEYETYTGELIWVDARERMIDLSEVGPVAYSEGMRMASAVYAGRSREEDNQDD